MKYSIRIALAFFFTGWYAAACFYGFSAPGTAARAAPIIQQAQPLNVVCRFDFPALPAAPLEGSHD